MTDYPPDLDVLLGSLDAEEADGLRAVWDLVPTTPPEADALPTPEDAWARLDARLPQTPPAASGARPAPDRAAFRRVRPHFRWAVPGAVALAVVLFFARPLATTAPASEPTTVTLADGTSVTLRAGSTLSRQRLGGGRAMRLEGEAFFDVVSNGEPFSVQTGEARVEVLGTRFSVRAWPEEGVTTVALEEGRVRLVPEASPEATVVMAPGEVRRVGTSGAAPEAVAGGVADALAWRQGRLVYKDAPLAHVLADVGRRFDVDIRASALRQRRVSVALSRPASAEAVVRDLSLALGLQYRPTAEGFVLTPADR